MHIYQNHLGGLYASNDYYEEYTKRCEQCGDSDKYLGFYENAKEMYDDQHDLVKKMFFYRPYSLSYLEELFTNATN